MSLFTVYKWYGNVPLYLYPLDMSSMRKYLIEKYGSLKRGKEALRHEYRCFLSENAVWRKVMVTHVDSYIEPPVSPNLILSVVMFRGTTPNFNYVEYLHSKGVNINPYTTSESLCFGFYCKDNFSKLDEILGELSEKHLIKDAMIVNSIWYTKLGRHVNLRRLAESGLFVPSFSNTFKLVTGVVEYSKVAIFYSGTIRIMRALTPEQAKDILGRVYALMLKYRALE